MLKNNTLENSKAGAGKTDRDAYMMPLGTEIHKYSIVFKCLSEFPMPTKHTPCLVCMRTWRQRKLCRQEKKLPSYKEAKYISKQEIPNLLLDSYLHSVSAQVNVWH